VPITNFLENKLQDHLWRTTAYTAPATIYFGLIVASEGYWQATFAYTSGDTVLPTTPNGRMYRCSTSGTSGGSQPTWPTTPGGTVADGSAVWTEMTPDFEAGTNLVEVTGGSYARVGVTKGDAQFKGTHNATTGASSGTGGNIKNAGDIQFASPSATWGLVAAWIRNDASTSGNNEWYGMLTTPKQVNSGDAAPKISAEGLSCTLDG